MTRAQICRVRHIHPHPNADKLDLLSIEIPTTPEIPISFMVTAEVVTGKHYREGQLGVYIPAGLTIPGWMAEDMWLFGRATAMRQRFEVRPVKLRGIESPGLFVGSIYRKVPDDPRSIERYEKQLVEGGLKVALPGSEWIQWAFWRSWWKLGDDVTAYLGITETGSTQWASNTSAAEAQTTGTATS